MKDIFITKSIHGTINLYISKEIIKSMDSNKFTAMDLAMEAFSIWRSNIEDTHIGWEFSKEFSPKLLKTALRKLTGLIAEME